MIGVTQAKIEDLIPYSQNARTHSVEQIQKIAHSIKEFGFNNPILVDKKKGIIAGHGRLEAAKILNLSVVPIIELSHLSKTQQKAYILADNRLALDAGWNPELLKVEFEALKELDFDIRLTGFSQDEIDVYLNPDVLKNGLCDPDDVPAIKEESITKLGDIWILGEHRLMCGDSAMINDIDKLMNEKKADMVFTDPPYGISVVKLDGNIGGNRVGKIGFGEKNQYNKKARCGTYAPIIGDDKPFDPSLLLTLAPQQIIWGGNNFSSKLPDNSHWIVWVKDMPEGSDFSGAELAWTNLDKKSVKTYKFTWAGMTREGSRKDELIKRVHPTQKPVGLFVNILNDYDPKNVMDLFGGSGSTLIACEKTNRKCFMMELAPNYCDIIIERWQKFTGQKAILESTGESYGESQK